MFCTCVVPARKTEKEEEEEEEDEEEQVGAI